MDVKISGSDDGPIQHVVLSGRPAPGTSANEDPKFAELATWLSGTFVLLTSLLTAVGSYTGGVARMMRNDSGKLALTLGLVLVAVVFGVLARELAKSNRNGTKLPAFLLLAGVGLFLYAMYLAITSAAYSVSLKDRPALSAQLVENGRLWTLKGTASAGGLRASQRMQVLGYAVPTDGGDPTRIFFVTTGPNADGVASETFEAPIPRGKFESIIVTANHGELPRDCAGNTAWYVQADPVNLREADEFEQDLVNACVTLTPPPKIPTP